MRPDAGGRTEAPDPGADYGELVALIANAGGPPCPPALLQPSGLADGLTAGAGLEPAPLPVEVSFPPYFLGGVAGQDLMRVS